MNLNTDDDLPKMHSALEERDVIRQSAQESQVSAASNDRGSVKAKVKGHQLVGSQDIQSDEERKVGDSDAGSKDRRDDTEYDDEVEQNASNSDDEINSVKERARASAMTIDTRKSPDPEKQLGDQKVIEAEEGPHFDQKVAVDGKVFMARIAEQGVRMEDMAEFIVELMRCKEKQKVMVENERRAIKADFTRAERNLILVAFKNVLGEKRVLVRTLDAISENPKYNKFDRKIKAYRKKIKEEIIADCSQFLDMLHSYTIDRQGNLAESEVFFLTLAADLTRYMCEQTDAGDKLKNMKESASKLYERAARKAEALHYCSPVKMTRDLHWANFLFEFMNDASQALKVSEQSILQCQA